MKQRMTMFILFLVVCVIGTANAQTADDCAGVKFIDISVPKLVVQDDLPIGTQIGNDIIMSSSSPVFGCKSPGNDFSYGELLIVGNPIYPKNYAIGNESVFKSAVDGVGYSIGVRTLTSNTSVFATDSNIEKKAFAALGKKYPEVGSILVRFYKIGSINPQPKTVNMNIGNVILNYGEQKRKTVPVLVTNFIVQTTTCQAVERHMLIKLNPINLKDFGEGRTAGITSFNIGLKDCNGLNLKMYLSPVGSSPDPEKGLLSADKSSTAKGVGFQLLDNNSKPVRLGKNGIFQVLDVNTVPMKVQYYKTSSSVIAGSVNSSATFTIEYN